MSLTLRSLSDEDLVGAIASLSAVERTATASLIAHLAELEDRRLHLAAGFRSLFGYCRHVLHCSEHEAYNRMQAVRAARRYPVIVPMLAGGLLHLTAVRLLGPHLRDEDHLALLGGAMHKSKREIVRLLAGWFPSNDVPSSIRKLPGTPAPSRPSSDEPENHGDAPKEPEARDHRPARGPILDSGGPLLVPPGPPPVVAPLSADRYRLQITISERAHDDLRFLQDAMRREVPDGDPAAVVERALALLRQSVAKKAFAATSRPGQARPLAPGSRHVPAAVERAVWARDQGQCSFEGAGGRCPERSFLEFHHVRPWVVGGPPSVANIALRCRAHNAYESAVYFAPIRAAIAERYDSFRNESGSTHPGPAA